MASSFNNSSLTDIDVSKNPIADHYLEKSFSKIRCISPLGQIQVHQNPIRGSFSSVLTEAVRAAGLGRKVLLAQFLKGGVKQGLKNPTYLCDNLTWLRPDIHQCIESDKLEEEISDEEKIEIRNIWNFCKENILQGKKDQIILDEISTALNLGIIESNDLISTLERRKGSIDVILTGPPMPKKILLMADQITELRPFK